MILPIYTATEEREIKPAFVDYSLELLFCLETGFHTIAQTDLVIIIQPRLASNAQRSSVPLIPRELRLKAFVIMSGLNLNTTPNRTNVFNQRDSNQVFRPMPQARGALEE